MNCQKCEQPVEEGATFCGNCGFPLSDDSKQASLGRKSSRLPTYTLPKPDLQAADSKVALVIVLGTAGIAGSVFVPVLGLALGTAGMVIATAAVSRSIWLKAGLVFSVLAFLAGLAASTYNIQTHQQNSQVSQSSSPGSYLTVSSRLATPCYALDFVDKLNVSHQLGSCDASAFNGNSFEESTDAYKIYSSQSDVSDASEFIRVAKKAIETDIKKNMPGFTIDRQRIGSFADSLAYIVNISDKNNKVAVVEAAVMRDVPNGDNVFILIHANNGSKADLQILESKWQWK